MPVDRSATTSLQITRMTNQRPIFVAIWALCTVYSITLPVQSAHKNTINARHYLRRLLMQAQGIFYDSKPPEGMFALLYRGSDISRGLWSLHCRGSIYSNSMHFLPMHPLPLWSREVRLGYTARPSLLLLGLMPTTRPQMAMMGLCVCCEVMSACHRGA